MQKDGDERIHVLLPGVSDPERLGAIFDKRSRIAFRLVDVTMSAEAALQDRPPAGSEVLYELNSKVPYLLAKQVAIDGGEIADAAPGFDQRTHEIGRSVRITIASNLTLPQLGSPTRVSICKRRIRR